MPLRKVRAYYSGKTYRVSAPMRPCAQVIDTWGPNDGCREFMSQAEHHTCNVPSTHKVKIPADGYFPAETVLMCASHAYELKQYITDNDAKLPRVYRYRTIR